MLLIKDIQEKKATYIKQLKLKKYDASQIFEEVLELDANRRLTQKQLDDILAQSNSIAKEIGQLFKTGQVEEANKAKAKTGELKEQSKSLNTQLQQIEADLRIKLLDIPNIPHISVPAGNSDADNVEVASNGTIPALAKPTPHWDITKKFNLIDFELGNKITGAGFPVYLGKGARLQRALINFFLDEADNAGYSEVIPPILVNEASGLGTGQLPDKEGQMYHVAEDDLYLAPTAEVPVTNIYRDVIVKPAELPIKNTAYTPCFRREAGSYGKDVRGLNRLHQFDKVEIVQIQHPNKSYEALEEMKTHVASLLEKLELPYRIVRLCGGDLGFTSALTYDFEVYSAGQERWLEVSSVSNFETYQANRLKLRFKDESGKTQLAHTLNGSALALPRIMSALLENNFDGTTVNIPATIQKYTGFTSIS
jgi:seryl-tRNA synthetase